MRTLQRRVFRDLAADQFERHIGSAWRPRSGSKVSHRELTSAVIDSRDFLAARRRAEHEALLPAGPKIAVTGGLDFNASLVKVRDTDLRMCGFADLIGHGGAHAALL